MLVDSDIQIHSDDMGQNQSERIVNDGCREALMKEPIESTGITVLWTTIVHTIDRLGIPNLQLAYSAADNRKRIFLSKCDTSTKCCKALGSIIFKITRAT